MQRKEESGEGRETGIKKIETAEGKEGREKG